MGLKKLIGNSRGFTVIEVIVVVVVIGVLAAVTIVRYDDFQKSVIAAQLKSDLNGAATAMENARMFGNVYPTSVPSVFAPSPGVTLVGGSPDGKAYCIDASSSSDASIHYYVDQTNGSSGAQLNTCASRPVAPSIPISLVATAANSTTINLSWGAVSGATTYTLQRDSTGAFASPVTVVTQAGTSAASGSLVATTRYYYRVKATNGYGDSTWSSPANAITLAYTCADTSQYGTYPVCY